MRFFFSKAEAAAVAADGIVFPPLNPVGLHLKMHIIRIRLIREGLSIMTRASLADWDIHNSLVVLLSAVSFTLLTHIQIYAYVAMQIER